MTEDKKMVMAVDEQASEGKSPSLPGVSSTLEKTLFLLLCWGQPLHYQKSQQPLPLQSTSLVMRQLMVRQD